MPELIGSSLGYMVAALLLIELLFAPVLVLWFAVALIRALRRIAISGEYLMHTAEREHSAAYPDPLASLDPRKRNISTSLFGR